MAWALNAQKPPSSRPTVGVALEGGGALGVAHIGVLEWFEDHHIRLITLPAPAWAAWSGNLRDRPARERNSSTCDRNNLPVDVVKQMGADIVIAVSLNDSALLDAVIPLL